MENFKKFACLASILCFPFSALATETPLALTVPEGGFYYLKDTQNQSSLVHICSSQKKDCLPVAEISQTHLEAFLDEVESRQDISSGKSTMLNLSGFGLALLAAGVYAKYKKILPTIGLGFGSAFASWRGSRLAASNRHSENLYREFETQVRAGIIGRGDKISFFVSQDESNRAIMEEFTDFINQYGIPLKT